MSKIDSNKFDKSIKSLIAQQGRSLRQYYVVAINDLIDLSLIVPNPKAPFRFSDYPYLKDRVNSILENLTNTIRTEIINGVIMADDIAADRMARINEQMYIFGKGATVLNAEQTAEWFASQSTRSATRAFTERRIKGLGLSSKVWKGVKSLQTNVEIALGDGIAEGLSAKELTQAVKDSLNQPNRLYRRVKQEDGTYGLSKAAKSYKPGRGVYRSSYKNALRLTSTEINIAYRKAFSDRIQDKVWIVAKEIRLSNNHTCKDGKGGLIKGWRDMCDDLQGVYPKDFVWLGWHVFCRCEQVIVHQDPEIAIREFAQGRSTAKPITKTPKNYGVWVRNNRKTLERSIANGKEPYFIRDNKTKYNKL